MIWKVGLTGGIGCGKTTVAQLFIKLGVAVFSADQISHELSQKDQAGFCAILEHFGKSILQENGEIDRARLGNIVFNDPRQKSKLESIIHPMIRQQLHQRAENVAAPYCILDIPLLVGSPELKKVQRVLVVKCDKNTRRTRIRARSNWSIEKIDAVMKSQAKDAILIGAADDLIDNNGAISELDKQILALHHRYCELSNAAIAHSNKG